MGCEVSWLIRWFKLRNDETNILMEEMISTNSNFFLIKNWSTNSQISESSSSVTYRCKYLKCHDSALYSVACIDPNTAVTGDEDGFVKMWVVFIYGSKTTTCAWLKPQLAYLIPKILNLRWDLRSSESNSIMTFKRFDEFVSSFCKVSKCTKVQC